MKVKDAMHSGVQLVTPLASVVKVAMLMREHDVGAIPVGENDRLIGMVTDRDIVCRGVAAGGDLATLTARDVMSEGIIYCRDEEELDDAVRIMEKNQVRRLPVINKDKRLVGMLTLGDISHKGPQQLSGEVLRSVADHHA